jgi:transcriptional regulator with XRE-family HTH domain
MTTVMGRPPADPTNRSGAAIRARRQELGMTQQQLAVALEVSHSLVSRMETGDRPVSMRLAGRIAQVLGREVFLEAMEERTGVSP